MPGTLRLACFLGVFLLLALWEILRPARPLSQSKARHWLANLGIALINGLLTSLFMGFALFSLGLYGQEHGWGLFRMFVLPPWLPFILGVLILDLAVYAQHMVFHYVPFLWILHRVHHTDLDLDVSSGLRFHPVEILISLFIKAGVVLIIGIGPWAGLTFEILLNTTSQFTHANVKLPTLFEGLLRRVFVTPDMHRIHHSLEMDERNRNFGFSFSWWDRIFRTYRHRPRKPQETMPFGVKKYEDLPHLGLGHLLIQPWSKGRGGN